MGTKKTISMLLIVSVLVVMVCAQTEEELLKECTNQCKPQCLKDNPNVDPAACEPACKDACAIIVRNNQDPGLPFPTRKLKY